MNELRTASILQRVPVILAVTAASYGLPAEANSHARALRTGIGDTRPDVASASALDGAGRDAPATHH